MKMIALSTLLVLCFLNRNTVSARLNPKPIVPNSSKKPADVLHKYKTRETKMASSTERQMDKRVSKGNYLTQHKRGEKVVDLDMKYCGPYPTIVQVKEPIKYGNFYLPSFVELHRCAGGCALHPSVGFCNVTKEESITIHVTVHGHDSQNQRLQVVMSNHTECTCACVPQKCYPKQRFNTEHCSCECIDIKDKDNCQATDIKQWDKNHCQCICSIVHNCDLGYKFDFKTCQCEVDRAGMLARL
ncbi:uncharacterized protein LOC111342527 isoform X1 [Stylophora pistillata]|uniref:uncharacterized protein LOC111342527 isoform X1 n=1 Tax=Stylophora pistillata TaxID=50429 RepID=UPI000C048D74|nr:uncharacterized protein LOC111342527 isoform X1 [Stylophora pistillata]